MKKKPTRYFWLPSSQCASAVKHSGHHGKKHFSQIIKKNFVTPYRASFLTKLVTVVTEKKHLSWLHFVWHIIIMHSTPYHVQKLDILIMYTLLDNYNIIEFNNPIHHGQTGSF